MHQLGFVPETYGRDFVLQTLRAGCTGSVYSCKFLAADHWPGVYFQYWHCNPVAAIHLVFCVPERNNSCRFSLSFLESRKAFQFLHVHIISLLAVKEEGSITSLVCTLLRDCFTGMRYAFNLLGKIPSHLSMSIYFCIFRISVLLSVGTSLYV